MLDILRACFPEPSNTTDLMYESNLNWKQTIQFSGILIGKGLLQKVRVGGALVFHTTTQGEEVVMMWNKLRSILD
jgi:predicted transcriptional regulator